MSFTESFFGLFDKLLEQIGIVIDWTAANAVPYVTDLGMRIVHFDTAKHGLWLLAMFVVFIIFMVFIKKINKKIADENTRSYEREDYELIRGILCGLSILVVFIGGYHVFEMLQNIIVPELTIIEMLQNILQGGL